LKIITSILIALLTVACVKTTEPSVETVVNVEPIINVLEVIEEVPIAVEVVEQKKEEPLPKTKNVCITVYDSKLKKEVKKCKDVKLYQRYDGTKIN